MKTHTHIILFFSFLATSTLFSQECGTLFTDIDINRIEQHKINIKNGLVQTRNETYIPVKFHLVATNSGDSRVSYNAVLDQLNNLNRSFHHQNIQYYLEETNGIFNEFDHTPSYNDPRSGGASFRMNAERVNNAMNVFLVGNIGTGPGGIGQTLGYYTGGSDWIVMLKSETNDFTNTLVHEVGHFFSVAHPHLGWESDPWCDEPDESGTNAPGFTPSGGITERVDRSNCETTQDRLCDTPADYNGIWYTGPCTPWDVSNCLDPIGDTLQPMANNYMSYFGACSPYVFTDGQRELISADLASNRRNYLRPGLAPTLDSITTPASILAPLNESKVQNNTPVTLNWDDVPNAKYYLVRIAENRSLRKNLQQFIVEDSELTLENLKQNEEFFWQVRPFNTHYAPLEAASEKFSFETDEISSTEKIYGINNFSIFPNPLSQTELQIKLVTTKTINQTQILIRDLSGKIVLRQSIGTIPQGNSNWKIQLNHLPAGQYILHLTSASGIVSKKLTIL